MPSKFEIAQYLVNLHTLLDAQSATGISKSDVITTEYKRNWTLLKDIIYEEEKRNAGTR